MIILPGICSPPSLLFDPPRGRSLGPSLAQLTGLGAVLGALVPWTLQPRLPAPDSAP